MADDLTIGAVGGGGTIAALWAIIRSLGKRELHQLDKKLAEQDAALGELRRQVQELREARIELKARQEGTDRDVANLRERINGQAVAWRETFRQATKGQGT